MNNLEQALLDIITRVIDNVGVATDFVLAELPEVVQQLLVWKAAESFVYCGIALVIFLVAFLGSRNLTKGMRATDPGCDERFAGLIIYLFVSIIGFVCAAAIGNLAWLQIWLAPKVYLIEYAAELMK